MPENRLDIPPTSVSSLAGGIINDAQELIRQEMRLARAEIRQEVDKAKMAALSLAVGGFIAVLGVILLCFGIAHLITWGTGEAIPLFGSFLIIGFALAVGGGALLFLARTKASEIHLVPPQTAETMRENVQWLKNQT
jgi:membrane-bound ClpP family serine protease